MPEILVWSLDWEDPLEKEMATHSSILAWRNPGTGEPGGLLSMGSHRVRHDWSDLAAAAAFICIDHLGRLITPGTLESTGMQRVRHEWVSDWTELNVLYSNVEVPAESTGSTLICFPVLIFLHFSSTPTLFSADISCLRGWIWLTRPSIYATVRPKLPIIRWYPCVHPIAIAP